MNSNLNIHANSYSDEELTADVAQLSSCVVLNLSLEHKERAGAIGVTFFLRDQRALRDFAVDIAIAAGLDAADLTKIADYVEGVNHEIHGEKIGDYINELKSENELLGSSAATPSCSGDAGELQS